MNNDVIFIVNIAIYEIIQQQQNKLINKRYLCIII